MRLMVSGGGTGGHIYPALAVINQLKKEDPTTQIMYVGSKRGIESDIVPRAGLEFRALQIQGFKRSLSLDNFKTLYFFLKSVATAKRWLKEFQPDVVLGTGGYVSGAVLYAAARMGIPTVIHEQNSEVGMTNKFLSHFVTKIAVNFEAVKAHFPASKVVVTGNPRAQEVAQSVSDFELSDVGLQNGVKTALVVGGSQGALKINKAMVQALPTLVNRDYQIVFVTGPKRFEEVRSQIQQLGQTTNIAVRPYVDDMPAILPKMAVVVGRSGATSLAEITALGVPSILVPSPYVTADHQTKNAQSLVDKGAAIMLTDADLTASVLINALDGLMNHDQERQKMALAAQQLGKPHAADEMIALLKAVMIK